MNIFNSSSNSLFYTVLQLWIRHSPRLCASALTWVGDHDESAVRAVLDDLGDDGLEDIDVPLHQVEAALPLLLADAGSHHHQAGVGCHSVVWRTRVRVRVTTGWRYKVKKI